MGIPQTSATLERHTTYDLTYHLATPHVPGRAHTHKARIRRRKSISSSTNFSLANGRTGRRDWEHTAVGTQ